LTFQDPLPHGGRAGHRAEIAPIDAMIASIAGFLKAFGREFVIFLTKSGPSSGMGDKKSRIVQDRARTSR
jgi:hypothetical protein